MQGDTSHLLNKKAGQYLDNLSTFGDYQEAQNFIADANSAFENLSSDIRYKFDNDPAKLLEFLQHPKNKEEAIELGLIDPPQKPLPPSEQSQILTEIKNLNQNLNPKKSKSQSDQD